MKIPEDGLWKLIKWSPKRKSILGLLSNYPNQFPTISFKEMYKNSLENLHVDIAWGFKG